MSVASYDDDGIAMSRIVRIHPAHPTFDNIVHGFAAPPSSSIGAADFVGVNDEFDARGLNANGSTSPIAATSSPMTPSASATDAVGVTSRTHMRVDSTTSLVSPASSSPREDTDDTDADDNNDRDDGTKYTLYIKRWLVLGILSLLTASNGIAWIIFAPIQPSVALYYNISPFWVNSLSLSYLILFPPAYLLTFYWMQTYGLRKSLIIASVLQAAGGILQCFTVIGAGSDADASGANATGSANRASGIWSFAVLMIGQCMGGIAQPMFTNTPARISADWFGDSERNVATTIGAMSNAVGVAIGALIPASFVDVNGNGMANLLYVCAGIEVLGAVLCILFLQSSPPTPPSHSTRERLRLRALADAVLDQLPADAPERSFWSSPLIGELKSLMKNGQFLLLTATAGVGLGLFNAVSTLISPLITPSGYSATDAGNFAAIIVAVGLGSSAVVGKLMDRTKSYNKIYKTLMMSGLLATIFSLLALQPNKFNMLAAAFACIGATMLPVTPVAMECAAECAYPVSEDASSGILIMSGNLVGFFMVIALAPYIDVVYSTVFNTAAIIIAAIVAAASFIALAYNGKMKRQEVELEKEQRKKERMEGRGETK